MKVVVIDDHDKLIAELADLLAQFSDLVSAKLRLDIPANASSDTRVRMVAGASEVVLQGDEITVPEYNWAKIAEGALSTLKRGNNHDLAGLALGCFVLGSRVTLLNPEVVGQLTAGAEAARLRQARAEGRLKGHSTKNWWKSAGEEIVARRLSETSGKIATSQMAAELHAEMTRRYPERNQGTRRLPAPSSMERVIRGWRAAASKTEQ